MQYKIFGGIRIYTGSHIDLQDVFITEVHAEIVIGVSIFFGHGSMLITGSHNYNKIGIERQSSITVNPIHIGNGVRVESSAIILLVAQIGDGAVSRAEALVTKDVDTYTVVAGSPVKFIKGIGMHE